ncbi:Mobile element protein [Richelia intracellularis]|nr:Mobile element protein [Richelia intracellularis]
MKAAISNCIVTANTDKQKKLNSLLTLEFQTFKKVKILTV